MKILYSQHLSLTCKIHQLEASTPLSSFGWIYVRFGEETCRNYVTRGTAGFLLSGGHNSAKRHLHSRVGHFFKDMLTWWSSFFINFASLDFWDKTNYMQLKFSKSGWANLKCRSVIVHTLNRGQRERWLKVCDRPDVFASLNVSHHRCSVIILYDLVVIVLSFS